jgi:hypothetical protein
MEDADLEVFFFFSPSLCAHHSLALTCLPTLIILASTTLSSFYPESPTLQGHMGTLAFPVARDLAEVLTLMVCLAFRLSSKSLLTSDDYDLGAGIRKRHKGPEEEQEALMGMGKARSRNQSWDDHDSSSDFMSQVSKQLSLVDLLTGTKVSTWRTIGPT